MPRTTIGRSWRVVALRDAGLRVLRGILRFREICGALKPASRWAITHDNSPTLSNSCAWRVYVGQCSGEIETRRGAKLCRVGDA